MNVDEPEEASNIELLAEALQDHRSGNEPPPLVDSTRAAMVDRLRPRIKTDRRRDKNLGRRRAQALKKKNQDCIKDDIYREELQKYKNLPIPYPGLSVKDSPAKFWKTTGKDEFKYLHQVAMETYVMQASSAESERAFSIGGNIRRSRRQALNARSMEALTGCRDLSKPT